MLGPIMPPPGGGDAHRPLALAFQRRQTGDLFHEDADPERTHPGGLLIIKNPPAGGV